ncbi:J domain-containing protein [Nostoc parmelioides]|uniref:DnaJ domain-containing protein n=1 Tax=Nostoc parmelioides FACHB-3921 TaxID=2692909 RepID=A0ABR8BC25_9NOSO|nr:J domain-containing protein [Nostoc parmelioides]MBD2251069.1 DnaJ domain-containing protein [Nostoc parmelioides FACHB-3921]
MSNDKPRDGLQLDISHAYEILGLKPGASQVEVKQAYRKLVKIWHPDRFVDDEQKQQAETKIKRINAAYNRVKSVTPTVEKPASATPPPKKPVKASVNRWGAETFYNWGVESVDKKEYEEAIAYFTQAIRLNPSYIAAYKYRGFICSELGYEYRATSDLNKAAQLEGKIPKAAYVSSPRYKTKPKSWLARLCQKIKRLLKLNRY